MTPDEETQAALAQVERNALIIGLACLVAQRSNRAEISHEYLRMVSEDDLELAWYDDHEQELRIYELRKKNAG